MFKWIFNTIANKINNPENRLNIIVDLLIKSGTSQTFNGSWILGIDDLPQYTMIEYEWRKHLDDIARILEEREEVIGVHGVDYNKAEIDIQFYNMYCPNSEEDK